MISLLGPVLVYRVEERSIDLEPRARGVLAALALHTGQKVAQETLATFVWDVPPNGAASNIRSYVSRIRRILRSGAPYSREWLTTYKGGGTGRGGGYRLDVPKAEIDVFVFTMLLEEGQSALRTGDLRAAEAALAKALTL
jgi:DNA-binding SARP family transcriptional activator